MARIQIDPFDYAQGRLRTLGTSSGQALIGFVFLGPEGGFVLIIPLPIVKTENCAF